MREIEMARNVEALYNSFGFSGFVQISLLSGSSASYHVQAKKQDHILARFNNAALHSRARLECMVFQSRCSKGTSPGTDETLCVFYMHNSRICKKK